MQRVLVIDHQRQPLMPCQSARARELLSKGKAKVYRYYPFTIILTDRVGGDTQPIQFKIDSGSKTTGIALVADFERGKTLVWAAELEHRGQQIKNALESRRALRRGRRNRHSRYRPARFNNRCREQGWLPPSLMSRVNNVWTWLCRINRFCSVNSISTELVKFDTQRLQNPEIDGIEYQQGELFGYEVREYLLEKWGRKCVYCDAKNTPLEIEHIIPKSRGGSNRISNLTLSCHDCNQRKGNQTAGEFGFPDIQKLAKLPLKDAAAVNATRWVLYQKLQLTGLEVEVGTGGRTKFNRIQQNYSKKHWIDAACVGESGNQVMLDPLQMVLNIRSMGRGKRQMCQTDKYGFPKQYRSNKKRNFGFQTGDIVSAKIPKGKYMGRYMGRVTTRSKPNFTINGVIPIHAKYCTLIQQNDGYQYTSIKENHA